MLTSYKKLMGGLLDGDEEAGDVDGLTAGACVKAHTSPNSLLLVEDLHVQESGQSCNNLT